VACPSPPGQGLLHLAFFFSFQDSIHDLLVCVLVWWCCVGELWCSSGGVVLVKWLMLLLAVHSSSSCWLGWLLWC
jgi:hypothetical protein